MAGIEKDKVKQAYFLLLITLLGALLAYLLRGYLSSLLGAATAYILLRRPLFYLTEQRRWNKTMSAISLMVFSMVVLVIPVGLLSGMLSSKVQYMMQHYEEFLRILKTWNTTLAAQTGVDLLSDDTIRKITVYGAEVIPGLLSGTLNSVGQMAVMYFVLYFMMIEGRRMESVVISNSPFQKENTHILAHEMKTQTRSNAIGMPILVFAQTVFSFAGYLIFGMDEPFFWAVITGFAAVLPLVGTAIIWLPVSIYLYFMLGHTAGICVAAYSAIVLTNVDNVVRFVVLKKLGNTHPLITFFGVMMGISLFGFLGLIFGPLLISYFLILLNIYQKEYLDLNTNVNLVPDEVV